MAITLEQFNQLGLRLFNKGDKYHAGDQQGIIHEIDPQTVQYLKSIGVTSTPITGTEANWASIGYNPQGSGGNKVDMSYLDSKLQNMTDQAAVDRQHQLDLTQLPPGMVQGPKTADNVAGLYTPESLAAYNAGTLNAPLVATPPSQTGGSTGGSTGSTASATTPNTQNSGVSIYRDNNNNFFKVDAQGNKTPLTLDQFHALNINADFVPAGQTVSLQVASGGAGDGAGSGGGPGSTTKPFDPMAYGISPEIWNKLDPATRAFVESVTNVAQGQFDQGAVNVSINTDLLNKALVAAQNDPAIKAKYGDAAILAQNDLQRNLALINAEYAQQTGLLATQQELQRKALAEQEAAAGRAYSGFRNQAKQQLAAEQTGVIESSKRQIQNKVNEFGRSLEQQYGTAGLGQFGPINLAGMSYNPYGNVQGSIQFQKQQDIENKQAQIFNQEKLI